MHRSTSLLAAATVLLVGIAYVFAGSSTCSGCRPWPRTSPSPCTAGHQMNYKVMADVNPAYVLNAPYNSTPYVTYGFCPEVDQLQQLHIGGFLNDTMLKDTGSFSNSTAYLRIYGLGPSTHPTMPGVNDSATVVLAQGGDDICGPGSIAVANFLVLNVTMKDGLLHYRDNGEPLFTGFSSSCSGGVCMFGPAGPDYPCIGNGETSNCAICVSNSSEVSNITLSLWISYYGTDAAGTPFISGQENPLNFREFALNSAYDSLANDINIP